MHKSKRSKHENDVDMMISDLPDHILHFVLSRLPTTEDVVRTSILSKRWRYLWTSIPSIDISCFRKRSQVFKKDKFIKFVDSVLANKTLNLESFRLSCSKYFNMSTIERWIQAAILRNVKLIDLRFWPRDLTDIKLPQCLVTCKSLKVLRLCLTGHPSTLPDCVSFPALRVLELSYIVSLNHDFFGQFLADCPLLEDVSLLNCMVRNSDPLYIACPKLKNLKIYNCILRGLKVSCPELVVLEYSKCFGDYLFIENRHSLKNVVILPEEEMQSYFSSELGNIMCKLLGVISHVESLALNDYVINAIHAASNLEGNFPASLPNLKTLELTTTTDAFTMNVLVRILICSPNLQSLNLIIQEKFIWQEYWEFDEVETGTILTRRLKRVEFLEFVGAKPKLDIARFLLKHGNALEEMVFSWRDRVKYSLWSTETMDEVSTFRKASSTVKLIYLLKD